MRIVHVITRLLCAGAEENTLATCRDQALRGHEVHLIHGHDIDPSHRDALAGLVTLHEVPSLGNALRPHRDIRAVIALTRLYRHLRPDLVHTHQSKAGVLGRIAARIAGVRRVVHGVHILPFVNTGPVESIAYLAAERVAGWCTDAFIDVSAGMRDICLRNGIGTAKSHHVVHSGFQVDRFRQAAPPEDWSEILDLPMGAPRPPIIVMVAAFEPRKRHVAFLKVLPRILKHHPGLRLLLVGDGPCKPEIEAAAAKLPAGAVVLTGYRPDPERLLALADICLLTSEREGLPRVILQYLAAGKPCVVSDLPGLDEVLEHNRNALIAPAERLDAVADAIVELLDNRARLAALSQAARDTDLSSWDVDLMCDRIEAVYRQLDAPSATTPVTAA